MALFRSLRRALAFLSRLPVDAGGHDEPKSLGADALAFPLAGLLIALPSALLFAACLAAGLSAPVASLSAVALLVWITAALHEDGLADTADALFGHAPRERALAIMRDSRIGTYGAAALTLSLAARILLLAEIAGGGALPGALALLGAAAGSRGLMAHLWSSLPPAALEGLAVSLGAPGPADGRRAAAIGLACAALAGAFSAGLAGLFLPAVLGVAVHLGFRAAIRRRLGGRTGDTIGCDQQLSEIAILLGFALLA